MEPHGALFRPPPQEARVVVEIKGILDCCSKGVTCDVLLNEAIPIIGPQISDSKEF
jgi:hypothetical protein